MHPTTTVQSTKPVPVLTPLGEAYTTLMQFERQYQKLDKRDREWIAQEIAAITEDEQA